MCQKRFDHCFSLNCRKYWPTLRVFQHSGFFNPHPPDCLKTAFYQLHKLTGIENLNSLTHKSAEP